MCDALVSQVLHGSDNRKECELFHTVPVLVDEVPPTIAGDGHRHQLVCPYSGASYVPKPGNQDRGEIKAGDIPLTGDNDRGALRANPVVRPDVLNVFGCYILLGPI